MQGAWVQPLVRQLRLPHAAWRAPLPHLPQKRMMMMAKQNILGYDFNSEGWMLILQTLEKIMNVLSMSENGC